MIIKYSFATGEVVEIEVANHIAETAMEIERATLNNNRRETHRHNSVEKLTELGFQFKDKSVDIAAIFEEQQRNELLQNELEKLLPTQRNLVQKIFFEGISITQIAQADSVCESAIRNRLKKIYKKLNNSQYLGVRI